MSYCALVFRVATPRTAQLVQRRAGLLQEHLHELDEARDYQYEAYSIQISKLEGIQHILIDCGGEQGGQAHDKGTSKAHARRGLALI